MGIFSILVFGIFTYIIIYEKKDIVLSPKIEEKLLKYIDEKYISLKNDLTISKVKHIKDENTYQIKLSNNNNKNLYFFVNYKNRKITDTYQSDYVEGMSLYSNLEKEYKKKLKNSSLDFYKKLNEYPETIRQQVINQDTIKLPLYRVSTELTINNHTQKTIINSISKFYLKNKELGYSPKEYEIVLVDKNDISFSVKISNLTENLIINNINEIISAIILNDSNIMKKYSIKYQYIT